MYNAMHFEWEAAKQQLKMTEADFPGPIWRTRSSLCTSGRPHGRRDTSQMAVSEASGRRHFYERRRGRRCRGTYTGQFRGRRSLASGHPVPPRSRIGVVDSKSMDAERFIETPDNYLAVAGKIKAWFSVTVSSLGPAPSLSN